MQYPSFLYILAVIIKYSDMGAQKGAGIIYEDADAESQLTETEQESAEVLKILSTEVGTVFYVTEQAESDRQQIAFTQTKFKNAISAIYSPDIVECVFYDQQNPSQMQSFVYAKK